ncbi:MAG TPA: hypothetical protein ENH90_01010, partial [bacterium]|nr:hypothetical protein [bacterium]
MTKSKLKLASDDIERAEIIWKEIRQRKIKEVLWLIGLVSIFGPFFILTIISNVDLALFLGVLYLISPLVMYNGIIKDYREKHSKLLKEMRFSILLLIITKCIEKYEDKRRKKRLVKKMDNISKALVSKEKKRLTYYLRKLEEKEEWFDEHGQMISFLTTRQHTKVKIK